MEELTAAIVEHGFCRDERSHTIDIRVMHKEDFLILITKDDCAAFEPIERQELATAPLDVEKNVGLHILMGMADDVQHQNLYGMNIWTIRV